MLKKLVTYAKVADSIYNSVVAGSNEPMIKTVFSAEKE
ncbi:hypothetical protein BATR1942_15490 [Bacillus atrophaeus 1942]|uniref:Uncharacterized protein n=1 Tax=Bacillus atrophaeus (strain 1942) TaxID=720555 RepID=A0ABN3ZHU6_BACA1|nr:hypothetical protein BATR1942_15490 [Bacillus atrophaeus 1942]EIM10967.1 hypothetical protein UY9_09365 [Bacillus atrophaeus C89]